MKLLIVVCCLMAVAMANPEFDAFKAMFGRKYKNPTEEAFRKKIFLDNKLTIDRHNQQFDEGKTTFTLGINQFADLTNQEFTSTMNTLKMATSRDSEREVHFGVQANPVTVDWRTKGYVTAVKDQGQCGSCWAFSATGSTEGQHFKSTGNLVSLSEQNLMDCSYAQGDQSCNGGLMTDAFDYMIKSGGVDTEASYPYTGQTRLTCNFTAANIGAKISSYKTIPKGSETELENAAAIVGPISVAIDASEMTFQLYSSGVYNEPTCNSTQLDHGVLVVGYGVDNGVNYWLVKNSWGTSWGEQGYIKMSKDKGNQCGIASEASYPVV